MNSGDALKINPKNLDSLTDLTRRYAAWTRDEGGLPLVWGGLLLILLVGHRVALGALAVHLDRAYPHPMTAATAQVHAWRGWVYFLDQCRPILLSLVPLSWVLGKDWLRTRLYHSFGLVEPEPIRTSAWIRGGSRVSLILAGFTIPLMAVWFSGGELGQHMSPFELTLGLTACWALPGLGWARVRGWQECMVWTPMALMTLASYWNPVLWRGYLGWVLIPLLIAMIPVAIGMGFAQHLRYLQLRRELRALEAP